MVRVFVVDDSLFMRRLITMVLEEDPGIKVVGTARDGKEALSKLLGDVECDAVTMDVEMPIMNGLETLKQLMASKPLPVLMLSSLTEKGAETTLKALDYGALDFIPKSADKDKSLFGRELRKKIKSLANRKSFITLKFGRRNRQMSSSLTVKAPAPAAQTFSPTPCSGPRDIVVIGVSTGGPPVVQKIFSALPANLPACILVAQHMPASFTGPFAKRLDNLSAISVSEATDGAITLDVHHSNELGNDAEAIESTRMGTIDIIFAGTDEVITVSHQAYSRRIFATGAITAARFLCGKPAGLYTMADVVG